MTAEISVQLYSVRDAMARDIHGTIGRLAAIGLTQVEPYGLHALPAEFDSALTEFGISAPSGHAPLLTLGDPTEVFARARSLGMDVVIDPHTDRLLWTSRDSVLDIALRLGRLARLAQDFGVRVGYHNHSWEFASRIDGQVAFDVFADALDPAVVLEIDTYWVEVGGESAPDVLRSLGDRVGLIHAKDGPRTADTKAQVPLGQGTMDVPAVLAAAPRATRVIEFDDTEGDVFDGIAASLAYLKRR